MKVLGLHKKRTQDYESGYKQGFKTGVNAAVKVLSYQIIQYLGDKRGWCRESIFRCLLWLHKHAEMILEEYTTFDEVVEAVAEEYGIVYTDDGENGNFALLTEEAWHERYPK